MSGRRFIWRFGFWTGFAACLLLSGLWIASHYAYVWAAPPGFANYGVYATNGALHYTGTRNQPYPQGWPRFGMGRIAPRCAMNWH
jgi:hypothetical protein